MKKALSAFLAFLTSALFGLTVLADGATPKTSDYGMWIWVVLGVVAVALVVFLVVSGKKK